MNKVLEAAKSDMGCHEMFGVDLNPFSTDGLRTMWQRGFDGLPFRDFDGAEDSFRHQAYLRGMCAKQLSDE